MKKLTVSIGIPAYNEEKNILYLLDALLKQTQNTIKVKEILIYCDGSTDRTPTLIKTLKNPKIKLTIGSHRIGQQLRQNQILKKYSGDVLVIIEADTLPANCQTIENLVEPFKEDKSRNIGMVIGNPKLVKPDNVFEQILFHGYQMKYALFAKWKNGENIYTCGGHSMKALSRKFTSRLKWPVNVPEDAYTYLKLKTLGLKLVRQARAFSICRNVTNHTDRIRQVAKFIAGKKALSSYFANDFLKKEYTIPWRLTVKYFIYSWAKNPIWITLYFLELVLNRLLTRNKNQFNALYKTYDSSKILKNI